jgi:rhamnose transport system ATP-binding protein
LIVFCCFEGEEPQINQQLTAESTTPIIALRGASKSYGAVRAARDVSIDLRSGEVRALAGENGAGKSTIVRMLAGVQRPDEGEVLVDGAPVTFHGPADARDAGVAVIYQEPTLFPRPIRGGERDDWPPPARLAAPHRIDRGALHRTVQELMDRLGVKLDPEQPVRGLSIADQQLVEIAKALSFDARVLIMDEPTAALSGHEVERLFGVVRTLRQRGAAVLFISHRLDEIFTICDAEGRRDRHLRQRPQCGRAGAEQGARGRHQGRDVRLRHGPQGP